MPTIKQLPAATSVAATDLLPLSQGGTTKALAVGSLLSSVQTAISVPSSKLLGRVSATAGAPEVVGVGTGLTIAAGSVAATGADHTQLPISPGLQAGDEVVVNSVGLAKRMASVSLRGLFSAGSGIAIDGSGTISATGGSGFAGVSTFNGRSGPITLTATDLTGAGGALETNLPQGATSVPLPDGAAAAGSSALYARQDHVHPTDATRLAVASNLSDLNNVGSARGNLGLGGVAVLNIGIAAGTVAAGDDSRIVGALSAETLPTTGFSSAGGSVSRTVADRASDFVLVQDYGNIDASGVADSTPAFLAALSTGRRVRVPAGTYKIKSGLVLQHSQYLVGDDRTTTILSIGPDFSAAATAVISGPGSENGPGLEDIGILFSQPSNIPSRAGCVTIAAAAGSLTVGIKYPPAVDFSGAARFRIERVRISGAWDGVKALGNVGGAWISSLEVGALNTGLAIDGSNDFVHLAGYHFWPFGLQFGTTYSSVFSDLTTVAASFGEVDGLNASDVCSFRGRILFLSNGTTANVSNLMLDDTGSTLEVAGGQIFINGGYTTKFELQTSAAIQLTGGALSMTGFNMSGQPSASMISVSNGHFSLVGGLLQQASIAFPAATVAQGSLMLQGLYIIPFQTARTVPYIVQTGGQLHVQNCKWIGGVGADTLVTVDSSGNVITNNDFGTNLLNLPSIATAGVYGPNGPRDKVLTQAFASANYAAQFNPVIQGYVSADGASMTDRGLRVTTNGVVRWELTAPNDPETGTNNAGSSLSLSRFDDTGASLGTVFNVVRGTGVTTFSAAVMVPTAPAGSSTTQIATTAFVQSAMQGAGLRVTTGSAYSMTATDRFVVVNKVTGSATAITLPATPPSWAVFVVKDGAGDASINNITVSGGAPIDGASSFIINESYESVSLVFNGVDWSVI